MFYGTVYSLGLRFRLVSVTGLMIQQEWVTIS